MAGLQAQRSFLFSRFSSRGGGNTRGDRPFPAETLRDDFRFYMPALLPKFVALLNEAERTNDFSLVRLPGAARAGLAAGLAASMGWARQRK